MGRHGSGLYTVFEGCETCGKSTQAARAARHFDAVLTRETGGTYTGAGIRAILHDTTNDKLTARTEALLTAADRSQHISEIVQPAIGAGRDVMSDRSWVSSLVYQGIAGGAGVDRIQRLTEEAIEEFKNPDLLIIIRIPYEEYLRRQTIKGITDRFEAKEAEFHRRVIAGYEEVAQDLGAILIDGLQPIDAIAEQVINLISTKKEE